jgi:hypothetical protein
MRRLSLPGSSLVLMLIATACTSESAGTGAGSTSGGGGSATAAATGAGGAGASQASSSASAASSSGQGGAVDQSQPLTNIVSYPDIQKPWEGAVLVRTNGPVSTWKLDGGPLPPPTPKNPELLLDTRPFADGEHTLWIEALVGGEVRNYSGKVTFNNGPPQGPALQGIFTDITPSLGIPFPSMAAGQDHMGAIAGDLDRKSVV